MTSSRFLLLAVTLILASTSLCIKLPFGNRQVCPVVIENDPPAQRFATALREEKPLQLDSNSTHVTYRFPRIVGGQFVSPNLMNRMAALSPPTFNALCTGAMISARWMITAAHCGVDSTWVAAVGTQQALQEATLTRIERAVNHPRFSEREMEFDIGVVLLAASADDAMPFLINVNEMLPFPGSFSRVVGYGVTVFSGPEDAEDIFRLRQVDVPVTTEQVCQRAYGGIINYDGQVCAGYMEGGCDSCQGDSGGPLIQYNSDGEPVMMASVSFGRGCAFANTPGVYVRTSFHREWMIEQGAEFSEASETEAVFDGEERSGFFTTSSDTGVIVGSIAGALSGVILLSIFTLWIVRRRGNANQERTKTQTETVEVVHYPPEEYQLPASIGMRGGDAKE